MAMAPPPELLGMLIALPPCNGGSDQDAVATGAHGGGSFVNGFRAANDITNSDVFVWALHVLGGHSDYVDVEDVYVRCHELAGPDMVTILKGNWLTIAVQDPPKNGIYQRGIS